MKKILLFLLTVLCGCKSLTYQDLNPTIQPNTNLLPAMNIEIDESSLKATYPVRTISEYNDDGYKIDSRRVVDERVGDVRNIFEKEVKENITDVYGAKKGYIRLNLGYYNDDCSKWYAIPSVLTVGTIHLAGFPLISDQQTLEVIVEIQDNNREVIKRYSEMVSNKAYVAMYWGYSKGNVARKVGADNIKQALEKIRYRINADAPEIKRKLN